MMMHENKNDVLRNFIENYDEMDSGTKFVLSKAKYFNTDFRILTTYNSDEKPTATFRIIGNNTGDTIVIRANEGAKS